MYTAIEVSKDEIESIRKICPKVSMENEDERLLRIALLELDIKIYSISDNIFASAEKGFRPLDKFNLYDEKCTYARLVKLSEEEEAEHNKKLNAFVNCQSGIRNSRQSVLNGCIQKLYVLENNLYRDAGYGFAEYC